jgi:hypothetical protein
MRPALSSLKVKSLPLLLENNHTISNASVRNANGGFGTMSQHFKEFTTTIAFMTGAERHSVFARKSKHVTSSHWREDTRLSMSNATKQLKQVAKVVLALLTIPCCPALASMVATIIEFMAAGAERHSVFARKSKHVKLYLALGPLHRRGTPGTVRR